MVASAVPEFLSHGCSREGYLAEEKQQFCIPPASFPNVHPRPSIGMVVLEYGALLQPCCSKIQAAFSTKISKSTREPLEDAAILETQPKKCQTACSASSWVSCLCGRSVACESPIAAAEATLSNASSLYETVGSMEESPVPGDERDMLAEEEICCVLTSQRCNLYAEEKVQGVPVDCLTRVPLDLYINLLEAGDKAKFRGGHTVARRRSGSSRRRTHLLKTDDIKDTALENEVDV